MKLSRVALPGAILVGVFAGVVRAAEPTKEDIARAEARAATLAELALASELAAFGRDAKSPESLAIAGGMLIRAKKAFGQDPAPLDVTPTDAKGNPVKAGGAVVPLDKQAAALFDEARAMAAGNPARSAALEVVIKDAGKFGRGPNVEDRGACGGPKCATATLEPGQFAVYPVTFVSGQEAAVCLTDATGPVRIEIVREGGGQTMYTARGRCASHRWMVGQSKDGYRKFTIKVTNVGDKAARYSLSTN